MSKEESFKKLELWLGFTKFLLGSVALGLITVLVNSGIKERELALAEQEHLATFKEDAMNANVGHRKLLAEFFSKVTQSRDLKIG